MVDYGEQTTGTRDEHYNLVSVLYHALHGAENCGRYASDAEVAGDERLAAFFREAQVVQTQLAERTKGMLGILEPPPEFGATPGSTPLGTDVPPSAPTGDLSPRPGPEVAPESDVWPGTTPEDVRRGTTPDAPITPPEESPPPYVAPPPGGEPPSREEPPPGEERPERRGEGPTPPNPREEPPPGEERPGRRTPP